MAMLEIRRPGRRRIVCLCAALAGVAAGLAIGLAVRGTPGASGASGPQGISSCAIPAWIHADGRVLASGSCAGNFLMSAPAVTVRAGQPIFVQMLQAEAIPGSMRVLVPAYPLPRSTNSWVLARTSASSAQATATFIAMHPGHAVLMTRADCLPAGPRPAEPANCPVIDVTVT